MRWGRLHPELHSIMLFLGALAGGPRWAILRILSEGEKTTSEIYESLVSKYGLMIPRSLLYYHLDSLENMGIIELVGYRETGKGGAPEKIWRLKIRRVIIDIPSGQITTE